MTVALYGYRSGSMWIEGAIPRDFSDHVRKFCRRSHNGECVLLRISHDLTGSSCVTKPNTQWPNKVRLYLAPFLNPSIHPNIHPSTHTHTHPTARPSIRPFSHPSVHQTALHATIHPFIHSNIHPPTHPYTLPIVYDMTCRYGSHGFCIRRRCCGGGKHLIPLCSCGSLCL